MSENDLTVKAWYESKTIQGAIMMITSMVLKGFDFNFDTEMQTQAMTIFENVLASVGSFWTLYGRVKATKTIAPVG